VTGRLVHLNGAPGVGKSTLARALVGSRPGWLNCDVDLLRTLVGGWESDFTGTGSVVRPLALAVISAHLAGGRDVVLPQLLADPVELERFVAAAHRVGASYTGILLDLPDAVLAARWRERDVSDPVTVASNRVIVADGGDEVVLDWGRRLRGAFAARPDVTTVSLEGLDASDALAVLGARIDAGREPGAASGWPEVGSR
jgi:predicted kinase